MYAAPADVRGVLARSDDETPRTAASLDDAKLQAAIDDAQSEVDAKLSARWTVPFPDPAPTLVKEITRDIAAYLAELVYREAKDFSSEKDPMILRYQRAQQLLTALANGTADLPVDPNTPESGGITVHNRYEGRLFGLQDFGLGVERGWDV